MVRANIRYDGIPGGIRRHVGLALHPHIADAGRFDQCSTLTQKARQREPARVGNHAAAQRIIVVIAVVVVAIAAGDIAF